MPWNRRRRRDQNLVQSEGKRHYCYWYQEGKEVFLNQCVFDYSLRNHRLLRLDFGGSTGNLLKKLLGRPDWGSILWEPQPIYLEPCLLNFIDRANNDAPSRCWPNMDEKWGKVSSTRISNSCVYSREKHFSFLAVRPRGGLVIYRAFHLRTFWYVLPAPSLYLRSTGRESPFRTAAESSDLSTSGILGISVFELRWGKSTKARQIDRLLSRC